MIEMELVGVRVELPANQPIVLLKEKDGPRYLPIWIGAVEATAIAFALQGVETARPLTHDLMVDVLTAAGIQVTAVHVTDLREGTYYAELHMRRGDEDIVVSSRTSDAIAIATRLTDIPVYGAEEVLDEAGIEIDPDEDDVDADPEEEVKEFREFLDTITPEDFREQ